MKVRNSGEDYGLVAKLLHWLIAVVFVCQIPIGWYMTGLSDEQLLYWRLLDLHIVLGLSLFLLVPLRLGWQLVDSNPQLSPALAPWERHAARTVHLLLLIAMVILPLTGFLFADSNGEPINLFNWVEIPDLGQFSKPVRKGLGGIHYYVAYTCALLIVVHVLAVVKHRFLDANQPLNRML